MRTFLGGLTILAMVVALASTASCATVEPGITVEATTTPISVLPLDVVSRTITIANTNVNKAMPYDLGFTYVVAPTPVHVAVTVTGTILGVRKSRELQMAVPVDWEFVAGSLKVNGIAATPPTISGGWYSVILDLPKTSTTTIQDQLRFMPPL